MWKLTPFCIVCDKELSRAQLNMNLGICPHCGWSSNIQDKIIKKRKWYQFWKPKYMVREISEDYNS